MIASAIEALNDHYQVRTIGFDIVFSEPLDNHLQLARAYQKAFQESNIEKTPDTQVRMAMMRINVVVVVILSHLIRRHSYVLHSLRMLKIVACMCCVMTVLMGIALFVPANVLKKIIRCSLILPHLIKYPLADHHMHLARRLPHS